MTETVFQLPLAQKSVFLINAFIKYNNINICHLQLANVFTYINSMFTTVCNSYFRGVHRPVCKNGKETISRIKGSEKCSKHGWCQRWVTKGIHFDSSLRKSPALFDRWENWGSGRLHNWSKVTYLVTWLEFYSKSNFICFPSPIHCAVLHQDNAFSLSFEILLHLLGVSPNRYSNWNN